MAELRQSFAERARLRAIWEAHPLVAGLHEQSAAFARREGLSFDAEGLNAALGFAAAWITANGPLPESGILIG